MAAASVAAAPAAPATVSDHVEFQIGALPIILTASHGGRETPKEIPDRKEGKVKIDQNTQELSREIDAELRRRTGLAPHMIINLLHRSKLDPNRDLAEAAQGDPRAEKTWRRFHGSVDAAKAKATAEHGFAFLIDVHGHGHAIKRLELGYALNRAEINLPDAELDAGDAGRRSTLGHMHKRCGKGISELIRGPESLGARFEQAGYPVVPSPGDPRPMEHPYYAGSYIVRHHASVKFPGVDGFQLECHFEGVRDTAENRARLARTLVDALTIFLKEHYNYTLPERQPSSDGN